MNMKKSAIAVLCFLLAYDVSLISVNAINNLPKEEVKEGLFGDINSSADDGTQYPESSYEYHIVSEWVDDNYGNDEYSWNDLGMLEFDFRDYYDNLTDNWHFEDDDNGNFYITKEDGIKYSFKFENGEWKMLDEKNKVVDTFEPHNSMPETSENEFEDDTGDTDYSEDYEYEFNDNDNADIDTPRVRGELPSEDETMTEVEIEETTPQVRENNIKPKNNKVKGIVIGCAAMAAVAVALIMIFERKKKK